MAEGLLPRRLYPERGGDQGVQEARHSEGGPKLEATTLLEYINVQYFGLIQRERDGLWRLTGKIVH